MCKSSTLFGQYMYYFGHCKSADRVDLLYKSCKRLVSPLVTELLADPYRDTCHLNSRCQDTCASASGKFTDSLLCVIAAPVRYRK